LSKGDKKKIFTGTANKPLAQEIADHIGIPLGKAEVSRFMDGEINIHIKESVRGANVFLIQPLSHPVNENIMELLILIDAVKRASAKAVNTVIPYYGYARQDRKTRARDPITAKLIADLLTAAGADRVIAMDLHAGQIQGFFNIPFDHLQGIPILANYFKQKNIKDGVVDDIIDTAGTISFGAKALLEHGAKDAYACCTHPVFSGPAIERLEASPLKEVVVTNTINLPPEKFLPKIKVLSVASLIGDAIMRIHDELSVSTLFDIN
jgi:ribose-phosphate pyrophosphokinase